MSSFLSARKRLVLAGLTALLGLPLFGQTTYVPQAQEYDVVGSLAGDQVQPALGLSAAGGYLVWEDNLTDGAGTAIVARRLNSSFAGQYGVFRVNQQGAGDQQKPQVALLKNRGAVVVWEGNQRGNWDIYAIFISSNGTFVTASELLVNTFTDHDQTTPAVACLADGNVVVVWGSFEQDGSYQGVFGQRFTPLGDRVGGEFQVNATTYSSQRTPVVAALTNGNFVVLWVSEQQRYSDSVDIFGRLFDAGAQPVGGEFMVNSGTNVCANPSVASLANGGFVVAWGQKGPVNKTFGAEDPENSWDIFARSFSVTAKPQQRDATRVNTFTYGDQYAPRVAALGTDALVVWTSLKQDGSREGVFGQFLNALAQPIGNELQVNTTTVSQQIHPAVDSDAQNQFLVVWSSFAGLAPSFDLYAQRFEQVQSPLEAPAAPYVSALSQSRLSVTWPELAGFNVAAYQLYLDGATTPVLVTSNLYTVTSLAPGSTHTVTLAYRLADGRTSPQSAPASGRTWDEDLNEDGLPDDWQAQYWGANPAQWPAPGADSDGDGVSNLMEFRAGTNPKDAASALRLGMSSSPQGWRLNWNTQPGFIYQVQFSSNFTTWTNLEQPRFAAGNTDSIAVDGAHPVSYYRVVRIR